MMPLAVAIAALVFIAVLIGIVGTWWALAKRASLRDRLAGARPSTLAAPVLASMSHDHARGLHKVIVQSAPYARLRTLSEQAGAPLGSNPASFVAIGALGAGCLGWLRTGSLFLGIVTAILGGAAPVLYLAYRRSRRMNQFQTQFPEALDTVTRSIRAGYAFSAALQVIADEMPEPVAGEFRRMFEEIQLGMDPAEALARLEQRVPLEDVEFFATAVRIQRGSGGNLAEVLDRLAEVIRERFKLLSHARVLSSQHRMSAVCVGLSPVIFVMLLQLAQPGYFDALLQSPYRNVLIGAGAALEGIGFFVIWRLAQIKV